MNKKGVEMSLNVVIVAAIGLLILVILAFLVVNYVGKVNTGIKTCSVEGKGMCQSTPCSDPALYVDKTDCNSKSPQQYCCKFVNV